MPCHVRPSPTPPRRDAAGCRASEPTGALTGGQRSNSAIIHLMLLHSQSHRPDETHSLIPAHSSSNIRDLHEPVSQSASHPRSIPFPILPTFRPRQGQSPPASQPVWPVRISVSTHPPTTPYPAPSKAHQQSSGVLPPFSRLSISQLPSSHPPQPQALLRSILEHFLARKPDLEALCFNSLRCAANSDIPLFNNNCNHPRITLGASFCLLPVIPTARDAPTQSKARQTQRGDLSCSAQLSSALSSVCDTAVLLLHPANAPSTPTLPRRGHPRPQRALVLTRSVLFRLHSLCIALHRQK